MAHGWQSQMLIVLDTSSRYSISSVEKKFHCVMSTESSQTSERVITIVQSSLPVTSATALDVDPSDVEHIGEIPLDGLQGLGNKSEDPSGLDPHFSDHAYAIPVKRVTIPPVTSPQPQMSSPRKRGGAKDEVMIVSDVGNDVEISQEETKSGKGRGRGRKSFGEIPLGNCNNREEKDNLKKKGKNEDSSESESEEDSPKTEKRKPGRPKKNKGKEIYTESESAEESPKKGKGKKGKGKQKVEQSDDDNKKKKKGKEKKQDTESESDIKIKKGKKGKGKQTFENESPKKKGKKGKVKEESEESSDEEESPKKGKGKKLKGGKTSKGKKGKKDESEDLSSEEENNTRQKNKSAKKNEGKEEKTKSLTKKDKKVSSDEEDEPLSAIKSETTKVQSSIKKDMSAGKNIFEALSKQIMESSALKRKHSETDSVDGKMVKLKHESGEDPHLTRQDSQDSKKKEENGEMKTPKSVKKKFRKSEEFLDLTMTDLFKPDGVVRKDDEQKQELTKPDESDKHSNDLVSNNQDHTHVLNDETVVVTVEVKIDSDEKVEEKIDSDEKVEEKIDSDKKDIENSIAADENSANESDETNELKPVEQIPLQKSESEISPAKGGNDEYTKIKELSESEVSPSKGGNDENIKIKELYKRVADKSDDLNSSVDSNFGIVSVSMVTSDSDKEEPIQFEATIENIEFVSLPEEAVEFQAEIVPGTENVLSVQVSEPIEKKKEDEDLSSLKENVVLKDDFETKNKDEKGLPKDTAVSKAKIETKQLKKVTPKSVPKRGKVAEVKSSSDLDTSDITGSEMEDDGRVLRRKRVRNPLVEEFHKKETRKQRKKTTKSEDEGTDKEVEKVEEKKKKGKEKVKEKEKKEPVRKRSQHKKTGEIVIVKKGSKEAVGKVSLLGGKVEKVIGAKGQEVKVMTSSGKTEKGTVKGEEVKVTTLPGKFQKETVKSEKMINTPGKIEKGGTTGKSEVSSTSDKSDKHSVTPGKLDKKAEKSENFLEIFTPDKAKILAPVKKVSTEQKKSEELDMIVQQEEELLKEGEHFVKKTHKGEIEIDVVNATEDEDLTVLEDIIVLRFIPGPNEEKTSYINLYSYLNSRSRCGVVGSVSKYIKDFYILPLASHSKIPSVIKPFVEGEEPEPYDPEKPTMDPVPSKSSDEAVFKKPLAPLVKRSSPSSSPGSVKTLPGAASIVSLMMDKLKLATNALEANETITGGLSPMATITDKQKILLELTQRVCEQKKLIELKHAGKSVQDPALPLVAVANAMTAISQISKTLVSAPKRAAISASQHSAKTIVSESDGVSSTKIDSLASSSEVSTTSSIETDTELSPSATSSKMPAPTAAGAADVQLLASKTIGLLPHEVAAQSEKMSSMPEALQSLFSSIPGSYSHVTKFKEADPITIDNKNDNDEKEADNIEIEKEQLEVRDSAKEKENRKLIETLKPTDPRQQKMADKTKQAAAVDSLKEGPNMFNVSLLEFDYGDSDSEADEIPSTTPSEDLKDDDTRPSSVMSSSSEESQDSANIPHLQYPPLPAEPEAPPPLPDEPPPPPPDHAPEEEEVSEEEEETGKKGRKKKKKKKKGKKGKPAPEIMLEAKDPISKAILDASFRRLMEKQQESMVPPMSVPMSPVVGPPQAVPMTVPGIPISGAGPPFQSPAVQGLMGPMPSSKPALLPTPLLNPPVAPVMMPQGPPMGMPQPSQTVQQQPIVQKAIPSLFDLEVTPSKSLIMGKIRKDEPGNELDRELLDLADNDWRADEPQDLDLRQDQDLRVMDVDMRQATINKPPVIPPRVIWPEDVDHRKGGRFTPDPVFGSDLQFPSEDSDLRNFCSPLDQDYRRRDMPQNEMGKDNFSSSAEDQDFRVNQNKRGQGRGSHDRETDGHDRGRRRRHEDSSHRKSKRRRRDDDRYHSRHDDRDHRHRDKDQRKDNKDEDLPEDVDQRPKLEKQVPQAPRLSDKVPVPPPQVLAQKAAAEISTPKVPPLKPPPLPPGIEVKPFTPSTPVNPPKRVQPPPPGIDDW
ncbi:unnamed protein product [Mytilus edulis]|uniref:Spen paralogue and orthologue SPOC C-terminal domain-containing protein n=1 Tax=Mytilus edulis TaxID=6550 RepID=A0A8S3V6K6_MYTED|nr:unnamed protein product [Mytilus edulis]